MKSSKVKAVKEESYSAKDMIFEREINNLGFKVRIKFINLIKY